VRRRRLTPERRRDELLDAAWSVLRSHGADARVEDITGHAGAAKGTFYVYFDSWTTMLDELRSRALRAYRDSITSELPIGGDAAAWMAFIDTEIDRFVDFQLELGSLHALLFHGADLPPVDPDESAAAMIRDLLLVAQHAGVLEEIDATALGSLLFHTLHGAVDDIAAGADRNATLHTTKELFAAAFRRWSTVPG
jgi:AcrR family transcriptional regulator